MTNNEGTDAKVTGETGTDVAGQVCSVTAPNEAEDLRESLGSLSTELVSVTYQNSCRELLAGKTELGNDARRFRGLKCDRNFKAPDLLTWNYADTRARVASCASLSRSDRSQQSNNNNEYKSP